MVLGMNEGRHLIDLDKKDRKAMGTLPSSDEMDMVKLVNRMAHTKSDIKLSWKVYLVDDTTETIYAHCCSPHNEDGSLLLEDFEEDGSRIIVGAYFRHQWAAVTWGQQETGFKNSYIDDFKAALWKACMGEKDD